MNTNKGKTNKPPTQEQVRPKAAKAAFSLSSFYHRRIRRIFPAYFVVVFCTLLFGIAIYHWARLVPLAQTALFSALFSGNIYFWLDTGYFQPNAHGNPLLNLWSLGVEEHFYIVQSAKGIPLYKDCDHLTFAGAYDAAQAIVPWFCPDRTSQQSLAKSHKNKWG